MDNILVIERHSKDIQVVVNQNSLTLNNLLW